MATTLRSLGDRSANRYVIQRAAYDANLPILRKVAIANTDDLAELHAKTAEVREKYFRVAESTIEYFSAVRAYCANDLPERTALGAVLAAERLTMRLLTAHSEELEQLAAQVEAEGKSLQ
jgi:hypothetical protein